MLRFMRPTLACRLGVAFLGVLVSGAASGATADYNTHTQVAVKNNLPEAAKITLTHQYSDDPPTTQTWDDVAPGATTPGWQVGYNTGFGRTGRDYWNVTATTASGATFRNGKRDKECSLTKKDADTTLVFGVSSTRFDLTMRSDGCTDDVAMVAASQPRPVWVVAHMCNAPRYIADALTNGANAVECDVECTRDAAGRFQFVVHHGYAGPGYPAEKADARTPLVEYLEAVRSMSVQNPAYVLQYFDCKIPDRLGESDLAAMGAELAGIVRRALYESGSPSPIYALFNCAEIDKVAFLGFARSQGSGPGAGRMGVTVDQVGTPDQVRAAFVRLGIDRVGWFTHGTNILLPDLFESMMRQAVAMRDAGQFNRVCEWTVNKSSSIDTLMTIGVDAILSDTEYSDSNGVRNFGDYIRRSKLVRLATRADSPFPNNK